MIDTSLIFTLDALKAALAEMAPDQPDVIEGMIANRGLNPEYLWVWKEMLLTEAEFSIKATGSDMGEVFAAYAYADKLKAIYARIRTAEVTNDDLAAKGRLDCKRLYIPGTKVKAPCPKCGALCERDLTYDYVSYPDLGAGAKPSKIYMFCEKCGQEDIEVPVRVKLTVELDVAAPKIEDPNK